jgi:hypothetical protein
MDEMENVTENNSKEEMYRFEIFSLLQESLGNLSEKEMAILLGIFMEDEISDEKLLKIIIE